MFTLEKNDIDISKQELVNKLMNTDIEKYILGRNQNASNLSKIIEINGIIDDFTEDLLWRDKPIFKSKDILNKEAIIISCSLAIYPYSAIKSLKKTGFTNILSILDIKNYTDIDLEIMFMSDAQKDLKLHTNKYENIYNRLTDDKSKEIFKNILHFRYNFDLKYMQDYEVDVQGQYFENFLHLQNGEIFVDAGGFDGQTSLEFIKHCPNYKSIYIFEPSQQNLQVAQKNLETFDNVHFIPQGLSNKKETLKFDPVSGSASSVSQTGTTTIEVNTLDYLVKENVSFIKMDIEGAESFAIEGMKNHILNDYPKMAISVYHKVDDFWKIPEQIFSIRDDYDLYMRHYTEGTDETIMFFLPKEI